MPESRFSAAFRGIRSGLNQQQQPIAAVCTALSLAWHALRYVRTAPFNSNGRSAYFHRKGYTMQRRNFIKATAVTLALAAAGFASAPAIAADTIKVGILHSLSGTMAISETALKETALMTIAEINAKGGVMGKQLEAVVVDPASNWPLFAEKARQLLTQDKVAVTFGCWTSVSRKSVNPVFKELNGLLFYPVQYEGEELEKNVFYTGAAPNQQAIPAVEYLMSKDGGAAKRWVLLGTDYVYPRTTNKILRAFLKSKGVAEADIMEEYTPFGHSDYQTIIAKIKKFAGEGKKTAVVSTINGDSNVPFYKELGNAGLKATDVPVVAFSVGEEELRGVDTKPLVGHLAAWNYFQSIKNPQNDAFIKMYRDWAKKQKLPKAESVVTNDPMEATYVGIHMWAQAVEKAKSTDVNKVIAAVGGQKFKAPSGFEIQMDPKNHHLHKPVFIGEVKADGQFNVVWKTKGPVKAAPWSPYIPGNDKKKGEPEGK
jgi:urea transport system substrate-binding protein